MSRIEKYMKWFDFLIPSFFLIFVCSLDFDDFVGMIKQLHRSVNKYIKLFLAYMYIDILTKELPPSF